MPILLPTTPLPASATPRPLDFGAWQEPIAGGAISRLSFLGTRMAVDFVTPRLKQEPDARIWASRLVQAVGLTVRAIFPQPGIVVGSPGVPLIDTGGQGGTALKVRGMTPGYTIKEGQAFNVLDGQSRAYIHLATGDVTVGSDSKVTIAIWPMLRVSPADAAQCNFSAPVIEGRLSGNEKGWTYVPARVQGLQFTVSEIR